MSDRFNYLENCVKEIFCGIQTFREINHIRKQAITHYSKSRKLYRKRNVVIITNRLHSDQCLYRHNNVHNNEHPKSEFSKKLQLLYWEGKRIGT